MSTNCSSFFSPRLFTNCRQSVLYCIICYRSHVLHQHKHMKSMSMLPTNYAINSFNRNGIISFVHHLSVVRIPSPPNPEYLFSGRFHFRARIDSVRIDAFDQLDKISEIHSLIRTCLAKTRQSSRLHAKFSPRLRPQSTLELAQLRYKKIIISVWKILNKSAIGYSQHQLQPNGRSLWTKKLIAHSKPISFNTTFVKIDTD